MRGVYAVGRPGLTRQGQWMAAVLSCGRGAVLSHGSAGALWGIRAEPNALIEVSLMGANQCRRAGVRVHRRVSLGTDDVKVRDGIPVTAPVLTLIDLAGHISAAALERAVNEADRLGLVDPVGLREALGGYLGRSGVGRLSADLLDRHTFRLTDSELEVRFLAIVRQAGLPLPRTRQRVNGFRVDFYWPTLGLVVETDGLRYHRTPAQQARDLIRDQAHIAAGMTPLRFTHAQVRFETASVRETLMTVTSRLRARGGEIDIGSVHSEHIPAQPGIRES